VDHRLDGCGEHVDPRSICGNSYRLTDKLEDGLVRAEEPAPIN
jgi:hypothetical protein